MSIGDPMVSPIPPVGTAGTGYASEVNDFLDEVKTRLEAQVPLSSVLVDTLDMQNNAIQNVEYLGLYAQTSIPTTPVGSLQTYAGELYAVTASGAVKITSSGALNASGIGGITGDYGGSNPAQLRFVDADKTYYFYDDFAGGAWAYVRGRAFEITGAATGSPRLRLTWAGSSSYTVTLPASAPASQKLLQMDSSGNVTASGVLGTNESITLSGTGEIKFGNTSMTQGFGGGFVPTGSLSTNDTLAPQWVLTASGVALVQLYGLKAGDRIQSIEISTAAAGTAPTWQILSVPFGSVQTALTITTTVVGSLTTLAVTSPAAMSGGEQAYLKITGGSGTQNINAIKIIYDHP